MRRGTTPTALFRCNLDLTGWDVFVTFEQTGVELTKTDATVQSEDGGCTVMVKLSQNDTLNFKVGDAQAQIRAYRNGKAVASSVFYFQVQDVLMDGVIP